MTVDLYKIYEQRRTSCLVPLAERLQAFLTDCLQGEMRIDRISARAKSTDRFVGKAEKMTEGQRKYNDPLNQIQDQVGARIVCFYKSDVPVVETKILGYLRQIENKLLVPDSQSKFGYFGKHLILFFPEDIVESSNRPVPNVFELQIKTLFQHAWSEAEHDIRYKSSTKIDDDFMRKVAFTAAQAWGADMIFDELFAQAQAANDAA
jgi:putative GTP pyrophosphokinase